MQGRDSTSGMGQKKLVSRVREVPLHFLPAGGVRGRSSLEIAERLRLQGFLGLSFSGFPRPELFTVSWPGFFSQHVFSGEDVSPGVVGRGIPNET